MIPRTAYIDYIGGRFEAVYYDRDEGRNYRWHSYNLDTLRLKLKRFFAGCDWKLVVTEQVEWQRRLDRELNRC
jgi:hypothetical protein